MRKPANGNKRVVKEINDIRRRAGINEDEDRPSVNPVKTALRILDEIDNKMVELLDELYDIRKTNPELGREMMYLLQKHDLMELRKLLRRN